LLQDDPTILARLEVVTGLDSFVGKHLSLLLNVETAWQPTDFLPDLTAEDWVEQVTVFRERAKQLDDQILVILVGGMVTEEALPSYSVAISAIAGANPSNRDKPWSVWTRGWTAEENRHGDLLNAYLRLTGRVDMRGVEQSIHHLLNNGFDPQVHPDPYRGLIYTAFQERATRISHNNVGRIAAKQGDSALSKICLRIAGDEARHESFYTKVMGEVMNEDPEGGITSFREMMRKMIVMPGRLMSDGKDPDLFDHFATVAQRMGVYTVDDYGQIIGHLCETWDIPHRAVSGAAAKAQNYLCKQAERYASFADHARETMTAQPPAEFAWIHGRKT